MARKEKSTLIDWRPLSASVFCRRKYKLGDILPKPFKNHYFDIIPKMESEPMPGRTPPKAEQTFSPKI